MTVSSPGLCIPCRYVVAYHLDDVYSLHATFEERIFRCLRVDVFTFSCADLGGVAVGLPWTEPESYVLVTFHTLRRSSPLLVHNYGGGRIEEWGHMPAHTSVTHTPAAYIHVVP